MNHIHAPVNEYQSLVPQLDQLHSLLLVFHQNQKETNLLLKQLASQPHQFGKTQYTLNVPDIKYLKPSRALLVSSEQSKLNKNIWCVSCNKQTTLELISDVPNTACGHLVACEICTSQLHHMISNCQNCCQCNDKSINNQPSENLCPVCSNNLLNRFTKTDFDNDQILQDLLKNIFILVDKNSPEQCPHKSIGQKRFLSDLQWPSFKKPFMDDESKGIIPSVRDGMLEISKRAFEVGSNIFQKISTIDEDD